MKNKRKVNENISGSEILLLSLLEEETDTVFGYPGGAIMPVFDALYDYKKELRHILVRHEQAAVHAAQGYARVSGKVGVALVTSGPGATNTITGIADAMIDSTPVVVISGQVVSSLLGTDAFQEIDIVGISQPVTKWSYQVRKAEDIAWAVAQAFYIARTGRPGPVVLDFTKDAQLATAGYYYEKCKSIRSYIPCPSINKDSIRQAAEAINSAEKPFALVGQGVELGNAEKELLDFIEKAQIPSAWTLLGASVIPSEHQLNKGMLGMHGNLAPNLKTNECDVLIAIGMRFDDRVTGNLNEYAKQAKIIHFDIDPAETGKNVDVDIPVLGNVKETLPEVTKLLKKVSRNDWIESFDIAAQEEYDKVIENEIYGKEKYITMGEVVRCVSEATGDEAVIVTDVGQNQMMGARYSKRKNPRSFISSGGLGTMGFGLPAAIGAKIGAPDRTVCLFCGDGGIQMSIQELGTIMQSNVKVKIIILNNKYLGMVRQWQEMFHNKRYSATPMLNPDFVKLAESYRIKGRKVSQREDLNAAIGEMLEHNGAYLLEVEVEKKGMVFPMIPAGTAVTNVILEK
ncbi:MAG: biosynthetic-type acetolactate synthase large subunit [Prevotellaceae bacterium]|jgi:acetolactate synthase-1/2/3 large subunit|nr:biosynthetic-type acetolactate synthase large subunit [Prevotellaceae bacterium]